MLARLNAKGANMITEKDWHAIGQALYGGARGWVISLSRDLGVHHRTLKTHIYQKAQWFRDQSAVESRLRELIRQRISKLEALARRFKPTEDSPPR